jgi:hypothetical protein
VNASDISDFVFVSRIMVPRPGGRMLLCSSGDGSSRLEKDADVVLRRLGSSPIRLWEARHPWLTRLLRDSLDSIGCDAGWCTRTAEPEG